MFCPSCKSMLRGVVKDGKKVLGCSCGYTKEGGGMTVAEKAHGKKDVELIDKEVETKPLVDERCEKCEHGKAYFWSIQTRAGDEPETRFFRCEKCSHTWREYS